jgi:hypothetical protein
VNSNEQSKKQKGKKMNLHAWFNTRKIATGELYFQTGFPMEAKTGFIHGQNFRDERGMIVPTIFSKCGKFVSCFVGFSDENPPSENKEFTPESKDWKELVEPSQGEKLAILQSEFSEKN